MRRRKACFFLFPQLKTFPTKINLSSPALLFFSACDAKLSTISFSDLVSVPPGLS